MTMAADQMRADSIIFRLKPVFIGWAILLRQLPGQLFMTVWFGGFFGGIVMATGIFSDKFSPFLFLGALAFFAWPLWSYVGNKLNYGRTEYRFYPDRLEFEEGFFTINKKVVKFKDVREVTLHKGMLQRINGLGSIYLATLATGSAQGSNSFSGFGFGNISASGVGVKDIANPDETYETIRRVVDAQTSH